MHLCYIKRDNVHKFKNTLSASCGEGILATTCSSTFTFVLQRQLGGHATRQRPASDDSVRDENRYVRWGGTSLNNADHLSGNPPTSEIDVGHKIRVVTFSADSKYLVDGGEEGVRVWRVEDGKQMAKMETGNEVRCLAVSKDGRWIAAGTGASELLTWTFDATTYEQAFAHKETFWGIHGVDFSPDSRRLVSASQSGTATVWDLQTRRQVQTLQHKLQHILDHADGVGLNAAKYSPSGDQIATASCDSIRIWDSNNGNCSLVDIESVGVTPHYNTGLVWFDNHLLVISNNTIKRIEASTGFIVSEWTVPSNRYLSCIALPHHGQFVAYTTNDVVTFWDMSTHSQLALTVQRPEKICSVALSSDDRFFATGGKGGKITIDSLSPITVGVMFCWIMTYLNNFYRLFA